MFIHFLFLCVCWAFHFFSSIFCSLLLFDRIESERHRKKRKMFEFCCMSGRIYTIYTLIYRLCFYLLCWFNCMKEIVFFKCQHSLACTHIHTDTKLVDFVQDGVLFLLLLFLALAVSSYCCCFSVLSASCQLFCSSHRCLSTLTLTYLFILYFAYTTRQWCHGIVAKMSRMFPFGRLMAVHRELLRLW